MGLPHWRLSLLRQPFAAIGRGFAAISPCLVAAAISLFRVVVVVPSPCLVSVRTIDGPSTQCHIALGYPLASVVPSTSP